MSDNNNLTSFQKTTVHMSSSFIQITMFLPISHPIDTFKSRRHVEQYKSYTDAYKQIKMTGIKSLYNGFVPMYFNLVLKQPVKLAVYEHITNPFLAGLMTGITGLLVGIPMSYIKTNYQVNPNFNFRNLLKAGFFKSFVAWKYEAGKEIVGNTAFYGLYKVFNNFTGNIDGEKTRTKSFANGFSAGFIATYLSYPVDIMKSYKQTQNQKGHFKEIFNDIYYSKQIVPSYTNFWRGVLATATKHSVIGGIGMLTYETIKKQIFKFVLERR